MAGVRHGIGRTLRLPHCKNEREWCAPDLWRSFETAPDGVRGFLRMRGLCGSRLAAENHGRHAEEAATRPSRSTAHFTASTRRSRPPQVAKFDLCAQPVVRRSRTAMAA